MRLVPTADCRFLGQGYELNVPLPAQGKRGVAALASRFRELHLRTYGHASDDQEVEVVNVRLSAFGALPLSPTDPTGPAGLPRRAEAAPGRPPAWPPMRRGSGW